MAFNDTSELLDLIRTRGSIPDNAPDLTADRLLLLAHKEQLDNHVPLLFAARGEYLVKIQDYAFVAGQRDYRLPKRCAAVRQVSYLQADGLLAPIAEAKPSELEAYSNVNTQGRPQLFTFREHTLELWPKPAGAGDSMRVRYHIRPNRPASLANTSICSVITSITTPVAGTTRLNMTGGKPTSVASIDLVKSSSPFDIIGFDIVPTASAASSVDIASTSAPADLAVGDYVCTAGYTPFPNMPEELHEPLALRVAAALVMQKGDGLGRALLEEAELKEKKLLTGVLAPRSKGNAKTIRTRRWR